MAGLIAFFSREDENYVNGMIKALEIGNTEIVAGIIRELTEAELLKIEPMQPYSKNYDECIAQAMADQKMGARPELKSYPDDVGSYDVVYLGYPNYWGTMPMAIFTFLEHFDFTGITIRPFCTHEGSGMGSSVMDLKQLCPGAIVEAGLAIRGGCVHREKEKIEKWLRQGG